MRNLFYINSSYSADALKCLSNKYTSEVLWFYSVLLMIYFSVRVQIETLLQLLPRVLLQLLLDVMTYLALIC